MANKINQSMNGFSFHTFRRLAEKLRNFHRVEIFYRYFAIVKGHTRYATPLDVRSAD